MKPVISKTVIYANIPSMMIDDGNLRLIKYLETANCHVQEIIVRKYKSSTSKSLTNNCYAVVTFDSPQGAQSAICDLLFWPNGKIINVKECANNNHLQVNKTSAFIRQTFALENIPLDCLFHIYQYLTPVDVAKVSEASIALNNFAKENNIYKKFSDFGIFCSGIWNIEEFKCIVRYFGDNFKQITIDSDRINGDSVENLAFILRHCPNLEELRVKNVKLRQQAVNVLREEPCSFRHLFIQSSGRDIHLRNVLAMWSQITYLTIHCIGINQHPLQLVGDVHALERLSLANATINSNHFTLFLQKHVQSLRYLSLVNIKWTSESFYKSLNTMLPHLEQLQISVTSFYDSLYISGMHLKYLQLVGTSKVMLYPMTDLPQLEELDLVQMHGANCFVAAGLPNLRVLSINDSIINQFDGLIDVIESLPNLQRLILRRCYFWPDDIIYLFETNINLTEIELELPMMDATIYLLQSLAEIANERNTNGNEFHLRIIVYKIEPIHLELSRRLSYVSWILAKDSKKNRGQSRFDQWSKIAEGKEHHIV